MIKNTHKSKRPGTSIALIIAVGLVVAASIYMVSRQNHPSESQQPKSSQTTEETSGSTRTDINNAPAQKVRFSTLPEALQIAIKAEVSKQAPACIKAGQLIDYSGKNIDPEAVYASIGSAIITVGCDGGAATLFAKDKAGQWVHVASGQAQFSCNVIFDNPVPKRLLELQATDARCFDTRVSKIVSYDEAFNARFY